MFKKSNIYFFIDTSIFRKYHFNTNGIAFENLCRLCHEKKMHQITTQITLDELKVNIDEYANQVNSHIEKIRREIGFTNIYKKHKFDEIKAEHLEKELWQSLVDFYKISRIDIVKIPDNATKEVFNKYFKKLPPFGKDKKKHEFPDAFVLTALQQRAKDGGNGIYVISTDPDFKEIGQHYSGLKYLGSIDEILDICYRDIIQKEHSLDIEEVDRWIEENDSIIKDNIKDKIEDATFYSDDTNGEVESVVCEDITINHTNIIDLDDDEVTVNLNVSCIVTFEISCDNPEMSYFDSEDQEMHCFERCEKTITKELAAVCELKLSHDADSETFDIDDIELEGIDNIIISDF